MPIHTERLTLRLFTQDDFDKLRELDGDPAVLRYRSRKEIRPEMTREFLERAQRSVHDEPRLFYAYAVTRRDNGEWLGQCGLTVRATELDQAFAWYSLLPRYWGRGYMSEAVRALLYAGATQFKLSRLFAECDPDNFASLRVMEKAGMEPEGRGQIRGAGGQVGERLHYVLADGGLAALRTRNFQVEPPL